MCVGTDRMFHESAQWGLRVVDSTTYVDRYTAPRAYLGPAVDVPWDPINADLYNPDADLPYGEVDADDALDDDEEGDDLIQDLNGM